MCMGPGTLLSQIPIKVARCHRCSLQDWQAAHTRTRTPFMGLLGTTDYTKIINLHLRKDRSADPLCGVGGIAWLVNFVVSKVWGMCCGVLLSWQASSGRRRFRPCFLCHFLLTIHLLNHAPLGTHPKTGVYTQFAVNYSDSPCRIHVDILEHIMLSFYGWSSC